MGKNNNTESILFGTDGTVILSFEYLGNYQALIAHLQSLYPTYSLQLDAPTGDNNFQLYANSLFDPAELSNIQNIVQTWVAPAVWWTLDHTESFPALSQYTNADRPTTLQTFINVGRKTANYGLNAIKTIVEYSCDDIRNYQSTPQIPELNITFNVLDMTRNWNMISTTVDVSPIVQKWIDDLTAAQSTSTVTDFSASTFKSLMLTDLWNKVADYDTIWQVSVTVNDPAYLKVRLHGMQFLYYNKNS